MVDKMTNKDLNKPVPCDKCGCDKPVMAVAHGALWCEDCANQCSNCGKVMPRFDMKSCDCGGVYCPDCATDFVTVPHHDCETNKCNPKHDWTTDLCPNCQR